jgi:CheY-like chemotaxis protein
MTTIGSLLGKRRGSDEGHADEGRAAPARDIGAPRKRLLIVDDNETVLDILDEFLNVAYSVDIATNGSIALQRLSTHPADLILLDVNMPGTDGLTLLDSIRRLGVTAPVFVITGYDSPSIARRATQAGATAYLVKPVDLRTLDSLIAKTLGVRPLLA